MANRRVRGASIVAIILVQVAAACGGGASPGASTHTLAPSAKVVKVFGDAAAGCAIAQAWAGLSPIPELTSCASPVASWATIPKNSLVSASSCGQAWLDTECGQVYVFGGSSLSLAQCDGPPGPATTCVNAGSIGWADTGCADDVAIATATGSITLVGTWVSATYVEERQLTLFTVFDGTGEVIPVIDVGQGTLGDGQTIERSTFWFTVPGDAPANVAGLEPRVAHPFTDLPSIVNELRLESAFAAIIQRAGADGADISGVPAMPVVNVRLAGGDLGRAEAREAALLAFDWDAAAGVIFEQEDVPVVALAAVDPPLDLRAQPRDEVKASELVKTGALEGLPISLIVRESPELARLTDDYLEALRGIGLSPDRQFVGSVEQGAELFNKLVADGAPVIWIEMR
jgi:hypothetical protein